jgi:hypothetical protein
VPTTYPYGANFESFVLDTNSGCLAQVVPGSDSTLGTIDTYVIQVAGTYYMHAQLSFDYEIGSSSLCQIILTLKHITSTGTLVNKWARFSTPTDFDTLTSLNEIFSMDISALDSCGVGDIWYIVVDDGTGTSTGLVQDTSPPNAHFEGFYVGTGG